MFTRTKSRPFHQAFLCIALSALSASYATFSWAGELSDSCKKFIAKLPSKYAAESITVPENEDDPQGVQIEVYYFYDTNLKTDPTRQPTVFFNGGPGSDSHYMLSSLEKNFPSSLRSKIAPVFVDQRGNGCSTHYPSPLTKENVDRVRFYGSREIVRDAEAIRKKLLGETRKWNAFGQSYGGNIVHRYIEIAPKGLIKASAYGGSINSDEKERLYLRLKSQKRVAEVYFQKYPEDREVLKRDQALLANLCFDMNGKLLSAPIDGEMACGPSVLDVFEGEDLIDPSYWDELHWLLNELASDDARKWEHFAEFLSEAMEGDDTADLVARMNMYHGKSSREVMPSIYARLEQEGEHPAIWPFDEFRFNQGYQGNKSVEDVKSKFHHSDPVSFEAVSASLRKFPDLKLFLYSGELDSCVPRESFQEEVGFFGSRIQYGEFSGRGHFGYNFEPQVWSDLLD